ncbi:MAG TPA: hypothetical protein VER37_08140 [Thermomicrobiales bacterium]|nr:hypothetical protein [Thermomicrobiales bacterium]
MDRIHTVTATGRSTAASFSAQAKVDPALADRRRAFDALGSAFDRWGDEGWERTTCSGRRGLAELERVMDDLSGGQGSRSPE